MTDFDFRHPVYLPVIRQRVERLRKLRGDPALLAACKLYYRDHPAAFLNDFGWINEPRNPERGLPAQIPFVLFPRQVEFIDFIMDRWHKGESGLIEKSRDIGASSLVMALASTLCLFHRGISVGVGSRKEQLIDNAGDPSSLLFKARLFLQSLPREFCGEWSSAHMRIMFPGTQGSIIGEAGDQIGRGARSSIYIVDESAYLERPELIEASLSATTNCRIDLSSVHGLANPFARRRFSGKVPVFTFHWRSDPRKDDAWYARQLDALDPVTVAQEIDIDYRSSTEGQLIPSAWIQAAIDAHGKLGISPSGGVYAALDVADEGKDDCAFAARHGVVLNYLKSWSGKGGDIYQSVVKSFGLCDELEIETLMYDADGLGAGVRGDSTNINEARTKAGKHPILTTPFRGSAAVSSPEGEMVPKRKNKDFFANLKAQSWWALRIRFQQTHRAVVERMPVAPDDIISLHPRLPELLPLTMELSQPTYTLNNAGKVVIDKAPDGMRSPNLADAVMIAMGPNTRRMELWRKLAS